MTVAELLAWAWGDPPARAADALAQVHVRMTTEPEGSPGMRELQDAATMLGRLAGAVEFTHSRGGAFTPMTSG